jgi:hypothetical protein
MHLREIAIAIAALALGKPFSAGLWHAVSIVAIAVRGAIRGCHI